MAATPAGQALNSLEQLRSGLRIMALRRLRDPEAADEAVQETLARAVKALLDDRLRDPEKLGAFVWGIARHVIAEALRARGRVLPLHAAPLHDLSTHPDDPLHALITQEERDRIRLALSHLSPGDREILKLSFFDGLTPMEIAVRMSQPAERIRKRKSRALDRLRQVFSSGEDACHE